MPVFLLYYNENDIFAFFVVYRHSFLFLPDSQTTAFSGFGNSVLLQLKMQLYKLGNNNK